MKINRNALCPCGSGKNQRQCCSNLPSINSEKKYVNEAHEWMDKNVLKGRYPDLYGYLILVDHKIPAEETWKELQYWSEEYLGMGNNGTQIFHKIIDETIVYQLELDKQDGGPGCFCHKGCANCCYQPVACTDNEAALIYKYCNDNKISIDFEKLERQLKHIVYDSNGNFNGSTTWNDQIEDDQACSFLNRNDRICRIWEVRPFVCRVQLACETNEHCRSHNGVPDPDAIGIHNPACSYILSSIFSIHHDSIGLLMNRLLLNQK